MRADPYPLNTAFDEMTNRTAVLADAYGEAFSTTMQFLEAQRRMPWILDPEMVVLDGKFLYGWWKLLVEEPEPSRCPGFHALSCAEGQSRSLPAFRSLSASSKRTSSFPEAESSSICLSQFLASNSASQTDNLVTLEGGNSCISCSISSTVFMRTDYTKQTLAANGFCCQQSREHEGRQV